MSKFKKFISMVLGVVLCFTMAFSIVGCGNINSDDETVTVTDMLGEQVTVKKNPKKVACASRTTYDLLIAFGVADSIDGVYYSLLENEWSAVFDTKSNERYSLAYQESYETYIARGVDIVFSPEKYITDLRISSAITLLANTKLPVNTVALSVGFNDPLYFSRFFKKHTGYSPREYRTKSKNTQSS